MANKLTTTDELTGVRVIGGKKGTKRIGKVRRFVFHPKEKRVVGFVVKRPDLLWMFRRKDLFVAVSGINYANQIQRRVLEADGLVYEYCYPYQTGTVLDDGTGADVMYYSIRKG